MRVLDRFRQGELEGIRDAVAQAELRTSGEIVTYIVGECDGYPEAAWRGAAAGALIGLGIGSVAPLFVDLWLPVVWWIVVPTLIMMLLGYVAGAKVPPVRRWLVHRDLLTHRVGMRAESAFLEEEVFQTRERTGILVFVALMERRVVVLGDAGINARVEASEWTDVVAHMIEDLKRGEAAQAVLRGVTECGDLLERHGVEIREDDTDEIGNEPRLRDR